MYKDGPPIVVDFTFADKSRRGLPKCYGQLDRHLYKQGDWLRGFRQGIIGAVRLVIFSRVGLSIPVNLETQIINFVEKLDITDKARGYIVGQKEEPIPVPNWIDPLEIPFRPDQVTIGRIPHECFHSGENPFKPKKIEASDVFKVCTPLRVTIEHTNRRHGYHASYVYFYPIIDKLTNIVIASCLMPGNEIQHTEAVNRLMCNLRVEDFILPVEQLKYYKEPDVEFYGNRTRHKIEKRGGGRNLTVGNEGRARTARYFATFASTVALKDPKNENLLASMNISEKPNMKVYWKSGNVVVECTDHALVLKIRKAYEKEGFKFNLLSHPIPLPNDFAQVAQEVLHY
jgi:hypothetical protein